jgi:quercetin dioxygenase-like cupin family protein
MVANELGLDTPVRVLLAGAQTGGRVAVIELRLHRDTPAPRHTHAREDEVVYVLDGHLTFNLDSTLVDAPSGSCLILPRNSEHSCRVVSNDARLLVIATPAGLEDFYREVGTPGSLPVEQLVTTAACYGITITGPAA